MARKSDLTPAKAYVATMPATWPRAADAPTWELTYATPEWYRTRKGPPDLVTVGDGDPVPADLPAEVIAFLLESGHIREVVDG